MYEQSLKSKIHIILKKSAEDGYSQNPRDEIIHKKSKEDGISIVMYDTLKRYHFSCIIWEAIRGFQARETYDQKKKKKETYDQASILNKTEWRMNHRV